MTGQRYSLSKYIFVWNCGYIWHVIAGDLQQAVGSIPSNYFNDGIPKVIKRSVCPGDDTEPNTIYILKPVVQKVSSYNGFSL